MWIYSDIGFFSIVRHQADMATLVVRGRSHDDLELLKKLAHLSGGIILTADADYAFRIFVTNVDEKFRLFEAFEESIDYPNFKGRVDRTFPDRTGMHHAIHAMTARHLGEFGRGREDVGTLTVDGYPPRTEEPEHDKKKRAGTQKRKQAVKR